MYIITLTNKSKGANMNHKTGLTE